MSLAKYSDKPILIIFRAFRMDLNHIYQCRWAEPKHNHVIFLQLDTQKLQSAVLNVWLVLIRYPPVLFFYS